jgi:EmrB/QacA subfamily drug resistance transporter
MIGRLQPQSITAQQSSIAGLKAVRRWWVLFVVVAAQFMFVVDAFVVNVSLPSIRADLNATSGEMQAIMAVYLTAYATLVITGGRLGDIFGRRRIFVLGVLSFTATSLWCGLSGSGTELVLARLAQGAAAALMVPQVLATIHFLFPDAARSRAFAVFGTALGLGGAVGVALGGWLVTFDPAGLGWRSVFLVNLPLGCVIATTALLLMPRFEQREHTRLDLPGAVLLFLALAAIIGPMMAGRDLGWPVWIFVTMVAGAILLMLFLRLEHWIDGRGGQPLIELDLLADPAFLRGLATVFAFQFANLSFYLVITLYLQDRLGMSPFRAGSTVAVLALAFSVASRLAGRWVPKFGVRVLLIGTAIQLVALIDLACVAAWWPRSGSSVLVLPLSVFGFGQGLVMAPLSGVVLATVRPAHAGSGSGMLNTVHQAAGATGISLVGTVWFADGPVAALALLCLAIRVTIWLLDRSRRVGSVG